MCPFPGATGLQKNIGHQAQGCQSEEGAWEGVFSLDFAGGGIHILYKVDKSGGSVMEQRTRRIAANVRFFLTATWYAIACGPAMASAQGVTFSGDWEKGITGNGNWKYIQTVAADRFQRVTSPVRQGQYAARVEVRPGDDPISSSGERSEVLIMSNAAGTAINENEASGTQFYAFSVRLDSAWQAPAADANGAWAIIFQLHGPDVLAASPSVAVSVQNRFSIDLHSGDLDSVNKSLRWKSYPLTSSGLNLGHWVDLVLQIKFAKDFTGSVTVWRRDEGQAGFAQVLSLINVPTLQYKSSLGGVGSHYWKHGFYRSKQTAITNVLWLDGLTRGDTYDDVVKAAFAGTLQVLPLDDPEAGGSGVFPRVRQAGSGFLTIDGVGNGYSVQMVNILGQRTGKMQYPSNGYVLFTHNNCRQPSGCYFISLQKGGSRIVNKIFLVR